MNTNFDTSTAQSSYIQDLHPYTLISREDKISYLLEGTTDVIRQQMIEMFKDYSDLSLSIMYKAAHMNNCSRPFFDKIVH